ncbi:MAG: ferrous iron transport protein B [Planctomycetota bacterium]
MNARPENSSASRPFRVALIGNPNTGKSTLFNALSGLHVRTGNYPGVTVDQRTGRVTWDGSAVELIDLPGTYSLAPRSPDELVAVQVLTGCGQTPAPDLVICICNATALERNLYLATQVQESGLPVVLCLNMWDAAISAGLRIDCSELAARVGMPVVPTTASRRQGLQELQSACLQLLRSTTPLPPVPEHLSPRICQTVADLQQAFSPLPGLSASASGFLIRRALLDPGGSVERLVIEQQGAPVARALAQAREHLRGCGEELPAAEARQRYAAIGRLLTALQSGNNTPARTVTDRLDSLLTHSLFGLVLCAAVLLLVFSTIYWFSLPLSDAVETGLGALSESVVSSMAPGPFRSLLTDGVISGVGAVLVFLPQICLLFLFIGVLEDCGYMARAAFMMDRLMSLLGLSGRSFLPLMSSFACAVPGIMATRVIENRRDRFVTILVAPLMSCSARLPVYVLLIGTLIPDIRVAWNLLPLQGIVLFAMSSLGLIVAIPIAFLLRSTFFRGEAAPFLLELPDYRLPSPQVVLRRVWESGWSFVSRAGTLIFATSVLVWAAGSFPGDHGPRDRLLTEIESLSADDAAHTARLETLTERLNQANAELLENSLLGRTGRWVEPVFRPLGWDWKIGVGVLASFPAREVIIATLGTIYSLGGDVDEEDEGLRGVIRSACWPDGRPVFTIPSGLSIMVFFALCAQCVSTLMVIRRETNSWRWPVFCFVYMTALAYVGSWITFVAASYF